jgi:ribonuclease-3
MTGDALDEVVARLGLDLEDRETLRAALTHPSYSAQQGGADYERLEFLGDSVIACAIARHVYETFPDVPEGDLTRMKMALISGVTLSQVARELKFDEVILVGKGATRDASRDSVLENAFEAVVGAVTLELGVDAACAFVLRILGDRLDPKTLLGTTSDPKNLLQELVQRKGLGLPEYEITGQEGPAHLRTFTALVRVNGKVVGEGSGASKQRAQRSAAAAALEAYEKH